MYPIQILYRYIIEQRCQWVRGVQITNPSELDFAEVRRHCSIDQAGNLMLNFLQLPFKMNSSTSPKLIRESRKSILPFTSHDLNSQSHTCIGLYCWILHFRLLDCCKVCFEFCEPSMCFKSTWPLPGFFLSTACLLFLLYIGLAGQAGSLSQVE